MSMPSAMHYRIVSILKTVTLRAANTLWKVVVPLLWILVITSIVGFGSQGLWPHWAALSQAWHQRSQAQRWLALLQHAQQWACLRGERVGLCFSSDRQHCVRAGPAPWVIAMAQGEVLHAWPGFSAMCGSTWPKIQVVFQPMGGTLGFQGRWLFAGAAHGMGASHCFALCAQQPCWQVVLTHTGRLRLAHQRALMARSAHRLE